jgi:diadenosine tetraphosphate (Ap4A) HIT family hydrolase
MLAGMATDCPFCAVERSQILIEHPLAYAKRDGFPISAGHTLIIPRRHTVSFFDTTDEERVAMLELLNEAKLLLDREHRPDGYNIGINDGQAAGQTVMHLHIHLVPRYRGDKADPRGGIRALFPEKTAYWNR